MVCEVVNIGGTPAFVCSRSRRRPRCAFCGRPSSLLCDFPKGKRTCDKALCAGCAVSPSAGLDYCPDHDAAALSEGADGGVAP